MVDELMKDSVGQEVLARRLHYFVSAQDLHVALDAYKAKYDVQVSIHKKGEVFAILCHYEDMLLETNPDILSELVFFGEFLDIS